MSTGFYLGLHVAEIGVLPTLACVSASLSLSDSATPPVSLGREKGKPAAAA
jgi:hypothetical protein